MYILTALLLIIVDMDINPALFCMAAKCEKICIMRHRVQILHRAVVDVAMLRLWLI